MDGPGKKDEADEAATSAMRDVFDTVPMKGTVVIGEGEMDEAPMLYIGEKLGNGYGPRVDVAVDPLEGTNILASGGWNALTVIAVADHGTLLNAPDMYMQKSQSVRKRWAALTSKHLSLTTLKRWQKRKTRTLRTSLPQF